MINLLTQIKTSISTFNTGIKLLLVAKRLKNIEIYFIMIVLICFVILSGLNNEVEFIVHTCE